MHVFYLFIVNVYLMKIFSNKVSMAYKYGEQSGLTNVTILPNFDGFPILILFSFFTYIFIQKYHL